MSDEMETWYGCEYDSVEPVRVERVTPFYLYIPADPITGVDAHRVEKRNYCQTREEAEERLILRLRKRVKGAEEVLERAEEAAERVYSATPDHPAWKTTL